MEIPRCPNNLEGSCERSDTFVEKEGDDFFTIRCRTCNGINVWPKDKDEQRGRYDAFLKRQLAERERLLADERQRAYSIGHVKPGEK
jgi:hypothetical protein